jgi:radical SAM protein with 4Fe4S-binding SPASM domain
MSTDQVKRVLDIIRNQAEVPSVSWTGGEPTLRTDLVELTRYAVEIGLRVNLITNGTNLSKGLVDGLKSAGLSSAQVSIEGPDAGVHDLLTQVPGAFDRTTNGIKLLKESGIHVHTNTTLNRINAPHLPGIVSLAKSLGLDRLSMNMVIPCGSAPDGDVTITYTETADLINTAKAAAKNVGIEFLWYSPTPYCIFNPVAARLGGKSCAACDGLLSVAPNGDVLPCSSLPQSVGNLLKSNFIKVWNSRKALYWRRKKYAHRICKKCPQFDLCTGACPIYWKAMGHGELKTVGSGV